MLPAGAAATRWPTSCGPFPTGAEAWAALGEVARDDVEAYACYRVGYHRGLDALRRAGWRGSGYVRWAHPSNRGFLRCLDGLAGRRPPSSASRPKKSVATLFLRQLDPTWPPADLGAAGGPLR